MREEERKKKAQNSATSAKKDPAPKKNKGAEKQRSENKTSRKGNQNHKPRQERGAQGKNKVSEKQSAPVRVIPLGGLGEIGKNMTVVETDEDIIVIDCGMGFPDDAMPGIDLVIPDTQYLVENVHKIRGIFLTHGH
jgi:ribonuclease J